tara:strand:+ start:255 stop:485 length:231 start_codon:yes stop_codon:yes gene_type:complete
MRMIGAAVLGFALMVGSADAHHCEKKCTPVRTVAAEVVSAQPVRSVVSCVRDTKLVKRLRGVRPVKRLFGWVGSVR